MNINFQERADLVEQFEAEKTKEVEIVQKSWRSAAEKLTAKIAALEEEKEAQSSSHNSELERLRETAELKMKEMEQSMELLKSEFKASRQKMAGDHQSEMELLEERLMDERKAELARIEQKSREESIEHLESQRIAIDALKGQYSYFENDSTLNVWHFCAGLDSRPAQKV